LTYWRAGKLWKTSWSELSEIDTEIPELKIKAESNTVPAFSAIFTIFNYMCIRFIARIKIKVPKSIPPRLRSGIGFICKVGLGRRIPKIAEKRYVSAALENPSNPGGRAKSRPS